SSCKTLLGPAHALLRPQFVAARSHLRERDGEIRRIFVFLGGGDPMNETGKVLSALADLEDCDLAVDVVMGGACPHVDLIRRQAASMQRVCVHHQTTDMASLMAIADLAVGSGGTASWERCCLGLPTVAVAIADNQFGALQQLDRVGAIRYLGEFNEVVSEDYLSALQHLLADRRQVQTMSAAAMRIVDGKGCQRVRAALMESERALNGAV
ncbi:MAG: PseG/SpsG family protein, partial [Thermomicrobiales bacterium]